MKHYVQYDVNERRIDVVTHVSVCEQFLLPKTHQQDFATHISNVSGMKRYREERTQGYLSGLKLENSFFDSIPDYESEDLYFLLLSQAVYTIKGLILN